MPLRGALVYTLSFAAGLIPFVTWILTAPLGKRGFREEYLSRSGSNIFVRLIHEGSRYRDVLGIGTLHSPLLQQVPVRIFIPLTFLIASWLLWRHRRTWFLIECVLLVPTACWFIEMVNKSSRYLTLLAMVFAVTIGAAVTVTRGTRWRRWVVALGSLVVVAQLGANLLLLANARTADYSALEAELEKTIPAGEPVYGTITFWLALRDHTFISQERTTPAQAATDDHVKYFILGDRMMAQGDAWDAAYYDQMHRSLADIEERGQLVREIPSRYYGDLRVYRMAP
jgi:hypothetical protein